MKNTDAAINSIQPIIVEFYEDSSDACRQMLSVWQQVKETAGEKAIALKVDIDRFPELAMQYNIYAVPAVVIFRNDEIFWQKSGVIAVDEILEHLAEAIPDDCA